MDPMSTYADSRGRLRAIQVAGKGLADNIVEAVTNANLSLANSQTSQLVITVADPDLALLHGGFLAKGTAVDYGAQKLRVAVREVTTNGSLAALALTCRSRGIQAMKAEKGRHVWRGQSYTHWLAAQAHARGLKFLGEPSATRSIIERKHDQGQTPESSWDVAARGAQTLGYLLFESEGTIYFGRPSWLVRRLPHTDITWHTGGGGKTTPGLLAVPNVRDSDDDPTAGITGSLSCSPGLTEVLSPARVVRLHGMGEYSRTYLVTSSSLDLGGRRTGAVQIGTPVDPDPAPEDGSTSGGAGTKSTDTGRTSSASRSTSTKKSEPARHPSASDSVHVPHGAAPLGGP